MSNRRAREQRQQERRAAAQERVARTERRTRWLWLGGTAGMLVAAAIVVGLAASGGSSGHGPTLTPVAAGKPAAPATPSPGGHPPRQIEANLHDGNKVLEAQIEERLHALKGVPVVVNMWASWCPNCKHEFPFFQGLSAGMFRSSVAFVGLDSQDSRSGAEAFLREHPVDYPSIFDETAQQAQSIGAGRGWPTTIYYDRRAQQTFVHEGAYQSEAALEADIRTYALRQ
jgi:thiol-disulfide isomerase/thioredoxin